MIIKSIELNNIRSYLNQKIDFNSGVVVLSGDIGSGKTTILLAIEFALFGLLDAPGDSLLRKGTNEGSVALTFNLHNQDITIKRILKRKSGGVRQDNGYILINNTKKDMTPVEMKHYIIGLLNYPKESLTKRSLIYRYTTYTPQDQMKTILYDDPEERINTVRKIFRVDKYKKIVENSSIYTKYLRENKRELLGKISDLENKKLELNNLEKEKVEIINKQKEVEMRLEGSKKITKELKEKLNILENELKKVHEIKREKAVIETEIKHKQEQYVELTTEINHIEKEVNNLKVSPEKVDELKNKIKSNIKEEILKLENELSQNQRSIGEFHSIKQASNKIKKEIDELSDCPLCLQSVPHEHKENIKLKEDEKIEKAEKELENLNKNISALQTSIKNRKEVESELHKAEKELSALSVQIKNVNEKEKTLEGKRNNLNKIAKDIQIFQEKHKSIIIPETNEEQYSLIRNNYEEANKSELKIEIEKAKLTTNNENIEKMKNMLEKDINEKERAKQKLNETSILEDWLQNNFNKIVLLMEKHVLSKIYFSFNDYFKQMFELLVDDERLNARIDESFSPVIEQNGHETTFSYLSGGEKTSVCLAYRLALNKAISSIMSTTGGLLILDEPTDGFSSEQLDMMKDVFDSVDAKQTIIVSHENKIESIADHVIRITKNNHTSQVIW